MAMPEASVDEKCNLVPREYDIRPTGQTRPPRRYLRPQACRDCLRIIYGFVSFERILDILSERSAAFKKSTISTLSKRLEIDAGSDE